MFTLLRHSLLQFYLRAYLTPCTKPFEIPSRKCHTLQREHSPSRTENSVCTRRKCRNAGGGGPAAWGRLWVRFSPSSRWGISAAPGGAGLLIAPRNPSSAQARLESRPGSRARGGGGRWTGRAFSRGSAPAEGGEPGRAGGWGTPGSLRQRGALHPPPPAQQGTQRVAAGSPKGEEAWAGL